MNIGCRIATTLLAGLAITGCGGGFGGAKTRMALSAVPLDPSSIDGRGHCLLRREASAENAPPISVACTDFEKAHVVVYESQSKCNDFITRMFAANAATNTRLDLLTTFLTSVASVTTPTRAAHTLTAGAAISSGTKLSINNEYFNALTISHIVQAIQQSYTTDMASYLEDLDKLPDSERGRVSFYSELPRIQAIHGECSLAAAEATIATTLQSGVVAPEKPVDKPVAYSTSYTIINTETNVDIAKGLAMALNANLDLRRLTLSAGVDSTTKTQVNLKRTNTKVTLDWSASVAPADSKVKIDLAKDASNLTVSGTADDGDVITITATPRKAASTSSATASDASSASTTNSAPVTATTQREPRGKVARAGEALQLKR